jgi:hypothetical protein
MPDSSTALGMTTVSLVPCHLSLTAMLGPCSQCVCATGVWNGRREWRLCANYPGHEGELTHVSGTGIVVDCRKFGPRYEVAPVPAGEAVRYIPLGDGHAAIVDAADFAWLSRYRWRATGGQWCYPSACIGGRNVLMHRFIMNPPAGKVIDHANGNRWDNRRGNLRECTQAQNLQNQRKTRGTSRFKGVFWHKGRRKWLAVIGHLGKYIRLGFFTEEIDAALAYDCKARELFGAFACLNFPEAGRMTVITRQNMPARSVGMAPCNARGRGRVVKSEVQISKSETNSNDQNPKPKTGLRRKSLFGPLRHLSFGHCFEIRISGAGSLRVSSFVLSLARGPPERRKVVLSATSDGTPLASVGRHK